MYDALMAKITENGEQTKLYETNISKRILDVETNYRKAIEEMEVRHKSEINTLKQENVATAEFKKLKSSVTSSSENKNKLEHYTRKWCVHLG